MSIICIIFGLNIFAVFLFKREWLLQIKPFISLLIFNSVLFLIGYLLIHNGIGDRNMVAALKIPAPQQLLFWILLTIYRAIFQHDPEDTWHSMDWTKVKDGVFNFIFWVSGFIPVVLALDNMI